MAQSARARAEQCRSRAERAGRVFVGGEQHTADPRGTGTAAEGGGIVEERGIASGAAAGRKLSPLAAARSGGGEDPISIPECDLSEGAQRGGVVSLAVLEALGVKDTGEKVLLSLMSAGAKSTDGWQMLLEDLAARKMSHTGPQAVQLFNSFLATACFGALATRFRSYAPDAGHRPRVPGHGCLQCLR